MHSGEHLRRDIPLLASGKAGHYLDNAATALMPQMVQDAVRDYDAGTRGNVGRGVYAQAEAATAALAAARREVAGALGAAEEETIFTAGTTAALNLLAHTLGSTLKEGDKVLLSLAEHHSNIVPWQIMARRRGVALHFAPPADATGAAAGDELINMMAREKPRIISVAHTTNVGGGTADLAAIAAAKPSDALLVVDGAQHIPHHLPNLRESGADFYAFSGHKCYAPNGIGVLWARAELLRTLQPAIGGGGAVGEVHTHTHTPAPPPHSWEPGTPPITPAIGLAAAMRWRRQWRADAHQETLRLAHTLREGLAAQADAELLFPQSAATPIVAFNIRGAHPHDVCEVFAAQKVAVRGGHHCAQPLMAHLGIGGCVRISIAPYNTDDNIQAALDAARTAATMLK